MGHPPIVPGGLPPIPPRGAPLETGDPPEESWNRVATRYREYWSPRFRPYLEAAIEAFRPAAEGPLAVPGCGPGDEVFLLARKFPDRSIIATDPSRTMVALVWERMRAEGTGHIVATAGSADNISAFVRQAAGVFSAFTLQLLPNPLAALANWSSVLRTGGSITAIFWPRTAPGSTLEGLQAAIRPETDEERLDWESQTIESLPRIGLRLARDEIVTREMEHGSPGEYFQELVDSGPLQSLELRLGREAVERSKARWLQGHGLVERGGRWVHSPPARLWTLERAEGSEPGHH
jgi:SAM-dependent methyltransferase